MSTQEGSECVSLSVLIKTCNTYTRVYQSVSLGVLIKVCIKYTGGTTCVSLSVLLKACKTQVYIHYMHVMSTREDFRVCATKRVNKGM